MKGFLLGKVQQKCMRILFPHIVAIDGEQFYGHICITCWDSVQQLQFARTSFKINRKTLDLWSMGPSWWFPNRDTFACEKRTADVCRRRPGNVSVSVCGNSICWTRLWNFHSFRPDTWQIPLSVQISLTHRAPNRRSRTCKQWRALPVSLVFLWPFRCTLAPTKIFVRFEISIAKAHWMEQVAFYLC